VGKAILAFSHEGRPQKAEVFMVGSGRFVRRLHGFSLG
jgi:hypothetical protein